jgi:hypothetical protein
VRRAFNGLCQVIVQAAREPGAIKLTASSSGLASGAAAIRAAKCEQRPYIEPAK